MAFTLRFPPLSLRQLLTLPYVALMLLLAVLIGSLSYLAGRNAVNALSDQLLTETVGRISQAVERHVLGSAAVLEVAFPKGVLAPERIDVAQEALRTRFWLAASVHSDLNNYVYYGDTQGHFFGLMRVEDNLAQLRLRTEGSGPRTLYRLRSIDGTPTDARVEDRVFEPRERPWFTAAASAATEIWTSIYIDFRTSDLVATRARKVPRRDGSMGGVVATDVSLQSLSAFVRSLPLSPNGLAFVVEPDGNLIATSYGEPVQRLADGSRARLNARHAQHPLLPATHAQVQTLMRQIDGDDAAPRAGQFAGPNGQVVHMAYARIRDRAGLDWIIAVAVPRDDFLHDITQNVYRTLGLALLACAAVVGVGLWILSVVARDLRELAQAAKAVGDGHFNAPLHIERSDEIGQLAKSFLAMQTRLSTDRLTGLANREALMRRAEDRIRLHRRGADERPFTLLFLDVDGFKAINDSLGHATGDRVLVELGQRMAAVLREADFIARWAGDEFVVLLDGIHLASEAQAVGRKLEAAIAEPLSFLPAAAALQLGASIGSASYPDDGLDVDSIVKTADARMYDAKRRRQRE